MAISFFGFSSTSLDISLNAFGTNQLTHRHNTERYLENEKFFGRYIYTMPLYTIYTINHENKDKIH